MANKKISQLTSRTPTLADLMLIGDASTGFSYKATVSEVATIIQTDIADAFVTLDTTQTISGAKTFSNSLTLTSVSDAGVDTDKFLVLNGGNVVKYRTGTEVLSDIGGQASLTLTTTGSSGASTLVGATLNIPTYTLSGLGGVPTSRTLTINGTAYDLSADRSWSVGTITGSGTTNYLAKFSGSTAVGSSRLYDDGTNTIYNTNASSGQYAIQINANTTSGSSFGMHILGGTTSSDVAFKISNAGGTSEFLRVLGNGNLGLGVTNPVYKLDVNGVINTSSSLFAVNAYFGTSAYGLWEFGSDSNYDGLYIRQSGGSGTSGYVFGIDKDSHDFTINGKLILTSTLSNGTYTYTLPSATGTLALTSDIPSLSGYVTGSGTTNYLPKFTGTSAIGNSAIYDNGGNIGIGTITPSYKLDLTSSNDGYARQWLAYQSFIGTGNGTNGFQIRTLSTTGDGMKFSNGPNTIEYMRLDASGNLGLGVTPSAWSNGGRIEIGNDKTIVAQGPNILLGTNLYYNAGFKYITTGASTFYYQTDGQHQWYTAPSGTAGNAISFTQAMTLDASGNLMVGGTSSSGERLQVTGTIMVKGVSYPSIAFDSDASSTTWSLYSASSNDYFGLYNGTTDVLVAKPNGNVGIGTSSPSYKLDVSDGTVSFVVNPIAAYSVAYVGTNTNHSLAFLTNSTERMRITSGGNVGIGTTNPSAKLQIKQSTSNWYDGIRVFDGSSNMWIGIGNTGSAAVLSSSYDNSGSYLPLAFYTSDAERMRITSGGDVQIGGTTSSGSNKLTVRADGTSVYPVNIGNESATGGLILFAGNGSGTLGTITHNGSSVSYNTTSDYRLKQDLKTFNGLSLIDSIKVYDYEWKSTHTRSYGVMAHELQSVIPYAVTGEKDGEQMQGVDYSKLVPILIQSIKDLKQELDTLKNK